jgi:hypothetical protein
MTVAVAVLDNEAVHALMDAKHKKHRDALALIEAVDLARTKRKQNVRVVVPPAVRIEAGCDRSAQGSSLFNRLAPADHDVTPKRTDRSVQLAAQARVSVVDACVGEAAETLAPSVILTSDARDMKRLANIVSGNVTVATL